MVNITAAAIAHRHRLTRTETLTHAGFIDNDSAFVPINRDYGGQVTQIITLPDGAAGKPGGG
jgi:hypothetical protein